MIKELEGTPYVISYRTQEYLGQGSFAEVRRCFNLQDPEE